MSDLLRGLGISTVLSLSCAAILTSTPAIAAQVRGTVEASPPPPAAPLSLGYTRTRAATPAAQRTPPRVDVAVFLAAKESGVIPPPVEPYKVAITGLELEPNVAACVIDGKVAFTNQDRSPMTVEIEEQAIGTIQPGQTLVYECKTGDPKLRRVRVKEWPHIRGGLFVGEVGIVAQPNANGAFSMTAPQGKYEVQVIAESGPLFSKPVEVRAGDVDVGRLLKGEAAAAVQPETGEPEKTIEPIKEVVPAQPRPPKKEAAAVVPVPVLPKRDQLQQKKKEPGARPSEDSQELDFGEE